MGLLQVHRHPKQNSVNSKLDAEKAETIQHNVGRSQSIPEGDSLLLLWLFIVITAILNLVLAIFMAGVLLRRVLVSV